MKTDYRQDKHTNRQKRIKCLLKNIFLKSKQMSPSKNKKPLIIETLVEKKKIII